MAVVVPGLPEGNRGKPGEVTRAVAGGERSPAVEVAQRVDAQRRVMKEEDSDGPAPQQAGEPSLDGSGQGDAEAERQGEPDRHPGREGAAAEAQVTVGEQILGVAAGIGPVLAAKHPDGLRSAGSWRSRPGVCTSARSRSRLCRSYRPSSPAGSSSSPCSPSASSALGSDGDDGSASRSPRRPRGHRIDERRHAASFAGGADSHRGRDLRRRRRRAREDLDPPPPPEPRRGAAPRRRRQRAVGRLGYRDQVPHPSCACSRSTPKPRSFIRSGSATGLNV